MIRHTVQLRFTQGTDDATVTAIAESLRTLPSLIPEIRAYSVGRDLSLAADNAHLVVQGDFDDVADYETYRDHPEHRAIIEAQILPALDARLATQVEHAQP